MARLDRPLRLGVAGLGRAFTLMLPTFLGDARVQLAGACDPREAARAQFARDFDAPVFADLEALASLDSIDAIYIASPHQFHAEHTRIAAAQRIEPPGSSQFVSPLRMRSATNRSLSSHSRAVRTDENSG